MSVGPTRRCRTRDCWIVAGIAVVFLALHLPFMASALADIDSVNLALGIRDFDPAQHRPHPPGYPVFIALSKVSATLLAEPRALAIWSVLFGAVAAFALWRFFDALERADSPADPETRGTGPLGLSTAVAAAAMSLSAPLVWLSASRPMTDIAGLGAASIAQAVLAAALVRQNQRSRGAPGDSDAVRAVRSGRLILLGAFVSAVAIGLRSQVVWLTLPLLAYVLVDRSGRGAAGALIGSAVWFAAGALLWAVPLVVASGGPAAYWAAFRGQAGEDWRDASILATHPGLRELAWSLVDTFLRPWDSYVLGGVVLVFAAVGAVVLVRRGRKTLFALLSIAVPYGAFHLLFQETPTTRYAIPLVPIVAYFAVRGLAAAGRWPLVVGTAAVVVAGVATTQPKLVAFSRAGSPSASLLKGISLRIASGLPEPRPVLRVPQALGLAWRDERLDLERLPTLRARQWTALVDHWRDGRTAPVWYVAEPERNGLDNRHDLVQFDPSARRLVARHRWPFDPTNLLGGVRPSELDWYELRPPGWMMLDTGSLTPRMAGLARSDNGGLTRGGLRILVRRRLEPVAVLVGGRNLARVGGPDLTFTLSIDGMDRESWTVKSSPGFFLRSWSWPDGVGGGAGAHALLSIRAEVADGSGRDPEAAIEQFDLQPVGNPMLGFDQGWHEQEYDPGKGVLWRWTGPQATLLALGVSGDVELRLAGEAPSRYFVRPSRVIVRAGSRVLLERGLANDYDLRVTVPVADLLASDGRLVIETDQTFRPSDRGESADQRPLGLRVFEASLTPVSSPRTAVSSRTGGQ